MKRKEVKLGKRCFDLIFGWVKIVRFNGVGSVICEVETDEVKCNIEGKEYHYKRSIDGTFYAALQTKELMPNKPIETPQYSEWREKVKLERVEKCNWFNGHSESK